MDYNKLEYFAFLILVTEIAKDKYTSNKELIDKSFILAKEFLKKSEEIINE